MDGSTTIRVLVLEGGERLPVLLDRARQQPLFDPLVYAVSRLRGRAANTVRQHLVGLQVLLDFYLGRRIDLADRVRTGELLSFAELDGLASSTERHRQRGDLQSVSPLCAIAAHRNPNRRDNRFAHPPLGETDNQVEVLVRLDEELMVAIHQECELMEDGDIGQTIRRRLTEGL